MNIRLTRMQGLSNRFVVLRGPVTLGTNEIIGYCKKSETDGLLVVTPVDESTVEMKYWNADGSPAEMCGNGLRCVTRFAVDNHFVSPGEFIVRTDAGPLKVAWDGKDSNAVEVQVGRAKVTTQPLELFDREFYEVNVGNPHAVTFVGDTADAPVEQLGPKVEHDEHFPNRTNVEFAQVINENEIRLRTWERGVGETAACGTGMVAAANAALALKQVHFPVTVGVLGGKADVWLDDEGYTRMRGPAQML